jgi:hypothetical protein
VGIACSSREVSCICPPREHYSFHVVNVVNIVPFVNMFAELSIFLLMLHPLRMPVPCCDFMNFKITNLQLQPVVYARVHIRYLQNASAVLECKHVGCLMDGQTDLLTRDFLTFISVRNVPVVCKYKK